MMMKNKNSIGYWLLVIGFWLLVNHLPNSVAAVGQKSPLSSLATLPDPNSQLGRQYWQAELSMAKGVKDKITKNDLMRMIEQIRSIEFGPQEETFEPIIVPEAVPIDEPNEAVSETKEQEKKEIEPKLPYQPITDQTLQILKNLSQHPDKLNNPFELGETLFLCGYLKEAVVFYQEALKRKSPDASLRGDKSTPARDPALREPKAGIGLARDRAWILFQIGNCLRNDDPPTAIKMYRQLIIEYPNSLWKELAEARSKLLDWYQKDEPYKLIAEQKTENRRQKTEPRT